MVNRLNGQDKINQISDRSKFIEIRNPQYQRYERSEISEIRDLSSVTLEIRDLRDQSISDLRYLKGQIYD